MSDAAALCTRHVPGFGRCGLPASDHQLNRLNHPYEHAPDAAAGTFPFDPDWVVPTADVLAEWLEVAGVGLTTVAVMAGRKDDKHEVANRLQAVLDEDAPLTDDLARVLAMASGIPLGFWRSFERNYRAGLAAGKTVMTNPTTTAP